MRIATPVFRHRTFQVSFATAAVITALLSTSARAQSTAGAADVTYSRDIAPILQRSCENCHRPGGGAPMSLRTYEEVRPWARAIKQRTGIGPHAGVMPPWYLEKNIGIQQYKDDPSLSAKEVKLVAAWADGGAPRGNPADAPAAKVWADNSVWRIGTPDLIVKTKDIVVKANSPDWWGEIEPVPIPLDEDRYVAAVEIKEVNDATLHAAGRDTVGGLFVWHHLIYRTQVGLETPSAAELVTGSDSVVNWPVHEVGRNPDYFDPKAAVLLKKGSYIVSDSLHTHSNGNDTTSHLEFGYKFMPKGYKPAFRRSLIALGNGVDIDIEGMESNQQLHAYAVLNDNTKIISFEPHLHAPGTRMCLEAIWGYNIQTLSCVGYDHNWVRGYSYTDDAAPLLPKGTILHIIGYFDNTPANRNVPDPRNWSGSGNRSITNMFIDLGNRVSMTDEQFQQEMVDRVRANPGRDVLLGCPLCAVVAKTLPPAPPNQPQSTEGRP
jgi:hypothetical protein